ncbi:agamous-like MADS-box protein AGL103 [Gastrolobium bilobum]|uniref:agamous-like MADS-box protein AGL103 n=1 Tax=Gastrolobium bilobum TaxID=150636 RepID=UPI002AAFFFCA|nr:agamous-like MADS-box protein AGL103 [Gastrolobium bilobum]
MRRSRKNSKHIPNDRPCKVSFMERRKRLMRLKKEVSDFSTKNGVEAILIAYDGNVDAPPVTWPQNPSKIHSMIEKYERQRNEKSVVTFDLEDYYKNKLNKLEAEISRVQKENIRMKYPTWDPSFDNLGEEELSELIAKLDAKLAACDQRIDTLKKEHMKRGH